MKGNVMRTRRELSRAGLDYRQEEAAQRKTRRSGLDWTPDEDAKKQLRQKLCIFVFCILQLFIIGVVFEILVLSNSSSGRD